MVEEASAAQLQEFDQINFMDCIPKDEELRDFLEMDPLAITEDDAAMPLVGEDLEVEMTIAMDFLTSEDDDERPGTFPLPPPHSNGVLTDDVFLSPSSEEHGDADNQYQDAIQKLRMSMKRSQESRQQIIRNQLLMQQVAPAPKLSSGSRDFFAGSRSTLTAGLEQSRNMLMSYMQQLESL